MTQHRGPVKFNHLELTFPRGGLTEQVCQDIDRFWCGLWGWDSEDVRYPEYGDMFQHRLLVDDQAIVLAESDWPLELPRQTVGVGPGETVAVSHLGIELASLKELERLLDACRRFQETDDRVKIWDSGEVRFAGATHLHHAFLVAYIMPIWFDVFARRWDAGHEPVRQWTYGDAASARAHETRDTGQRA